MPHEEATSSRTQGVRTGGSLPIIDLDSSPDQRSLLPSTASIRPTELCATRGWPLHASKRIRCPKCPPTSLKLASVSGGGGGGGGGRVTHMRVDSG